MSLLCPLTMIASCFFGPLASMQIPESSLLAQLSWQEELRQIDDEIRDATELRDKYLADARRAEDAGMRWQFQQNQKQEAKRAFERADEKKQAAQMLQTRIDTLNARKAQILQQHPEVNERSP